MLLNVEKLENLINATIIQFLLFFLFLSFDIDEKEEAVFYLSHHSYCSRFYPSKDRLRYKESRNTCCFFLWAKNSFLIQFLNDDENLLM